jgi:putative restriction endonuclease
MTFPNALAKYLHAFANLHRNATSARGLAPHKPILLLAILHEIEAGRITENLVPPSAELVAAFQLYWNALVPPDSGWKSRMATPFCYLRYDGFWELVKNGNAIDRKEYTLSQLATVCDGGMFADDLWPLLVDPITRDVLKREILNAYFNGSKANVTAEQQATYLYAQADKLRAQANARFVEKRVRESNDNGYFIRNQLFPEVVKKLYDFACCVCRQRANMGDTRSVVDGAHILPFASFHNDDPRNGIALCKNHHWGFDCGAWSLTADYRVLVSPKLVSAVPFIVENAKIHLPSAPQFHPDPVALEWHRENFGF